MTDETIPLEAGIEGRAISFNKGCYVGQEVIIRVLHRGHGRVAKKLVGLRLQGEIFPVAGSAIEGGGKAPGVVTSAAWSPRFEQPIALGYVHRELAEPGTRVTVAGSDAVVSALPFQQ
jgi:folate-binding protein YgfZ